MKLGLRIFGCYLIIFLLCFSYPISWVLDNLRTRYLEGIEDPLVDQANILAEWVGRQMAEGTFNPAQFGQILEGVYGRDLKSRIYSLTKDKVDLQIYMTDAQGQVVFHSTDPGQVGMDYTHWRDVALTLDGAYGARTTLADPDDPTSSVLYVAAPIRSADRLFGVLTVGKPTTNINSFLKAAKPKFLAVTAVAAAVAIALSYLAALWIVRPIRRLTVYAEAIRAGQRTPFPELDRTEIGDLGNALRRMQEALEGKAYVEQYVQKLTHEVKSPLSAIRGAAELLEEDVPVERKQRFLANIRMEANRIQVIVDRMLELAALESKKRLPRRQRVNVRTLVQNVLESKAPLFIGRQLESTVDIAPHLEVRGDPFLLHQALANLVQNAADFSRPGGTVAIKAGIEDSRIAIDVENDGTPIPGYALPKIFDKFYSLQRPDSGKKSTGLGLNLVKEVAQLHRGGIGLENIGTRGVRARLALPK